MTLGELLTSKGHTQAGLARHLGTTRQTVNYWHTGSYRPPPDTIETIASFIGVTTDDVYAALGIIPPDLVQSILDHAPASFATIRKALM